MRTGGGGSGSPPAGRPGDAGGGPRGRHRPAPRHGRFALRRRSAPPLRAARVRRSPAPSRRRRLGPRRVQLSARRRAATLPALGRRPGPGAVFADRELAGAFAGLLLAALLAGFLVYLVQYLQNVQGLDALRSGLSILPFGVALLLTTQGLTRFLSTVDLRIRAMGGLVVVRAGVAWLTLLDGDSTYAAGVLPQIVLIGTGSGWRSSRSTRSSSPPPRPSTRASRRVSCRRHSPSEAPSDWPCCLSFAGAGQGAEDTISSVFVRASPVTVAAILVPLVLGSVRGPRRAGLPLRESPSTDPPSGRERGAPVRPPGRTAPPAPLARRGAGGAEGAVGGQAPDASSMAVRSTTLMRSRPCSAPSACSWASRRCQPSFVV